MKAFLLQGHLFKQSSWNKKSWKRRWFTVRNNRNIYYYDKRSTPSKNYRGVIALAQIASVELAEQKGHTAFCFDIVTHRKRTHRFACANQQDLVDWITALEALVFGDIEQISTHRQPKASSQRIGGDNDDEKEEIERPTTPTIRGSVSAFASKFKQLTSSSRGNSPRHSGPFTATMTQDVD